MHFLDELTITVRSGKGGDGKRSFLREKSRPWGGPDGGDGGRGGSIWFEADANLNTFYPLKFQKKFSAPDGDDGGGLNCTGRSGEDRVILVPVGTQVRPRGGSEILADLAVSGQRWRAAKGGRGGLGNQNFATPTNQAPDRADPGQPSEEIVYDLELKLLADVGLLGLPNAGKSTFLSRVSAARPKIADYPFTTLVPNLGVVAGEDYRSFVIADIPGLIAGAHEGHGLGDQFLRHVARTKLLLHLVDLSPYAMEPPLHAVETIEAELAAYSPELAGRPRILCGTKADLGSNAEQVAALRAHAAELGLPFLIISAPTGEGLKALTDLLWQGLQDPQSLRLTPVKPAKGAARKSTAAKARPAKKLEKKTAVVQQFAEKKRAVKYVRIIRKPKPIKKKKASALKSVKPAKSAPKKVGAVKKTGVKRKFIPGKKRSGPHRHG